MDTIRAFLNKHEPWLIGLAVVAVLYMYQERPFQPVAAAEGTAAAGASGPTVSYNLNMAYHAFKRDQGQPNSYDDFTSHPLPPTGFSNCIGMNYDNHIAMTSGGWDHKNKVMKQCCTQSRGKHETSTADGGFCKLSPRPGAGP